MVEQTRVVIVGAGLAGLCCARALRRAGVDCLVLDAADRVGGRIATDRLQGFQLDRGFQVLLTSYPEARAELDYDALGLRWFRAGSLVRRGDRVMRFADPWRHPSDGLRSLLTGAVGLGDAVRMTRLRREALRGDIRPDTGSAADVLRASGLSESLRESFLEPFFRGVSLDPQLTFPAWYFAFLFAMFARGHAALPRDGMAAIPVQLAAELPRDSVRLGARVRSVRPGAVELTDGTHLRCDAAVIATDGAAAAALAPGITAPGWNGTANLYFSAPRPPFAEPMLMLAGERGGLVNNVCVPSQIQASYAPEGAALVSVSTVGLPEADDDALREAALSELADWFGAEVASWRHLRTYRIRRALPKLPAHGPARGPGVRRVDDGVWVCGDHLATPSIQGAMAAGRVAAERVVEAITRTAAGAV